MRATSAPNCITNVPIGTCVDTQCERRSEWKRVRADAASTCAARPDAGNGFSHILHACKGIPPSSRQIGWRALSHAQPHSGIEPRSKRRAAAARTGVCAPQRCALRGLNTSHNAPRGAMFNPSSDAGSGRGMKTQNMNGGNIGGRYAVLIIN